MSARDDYPAESHVYNDHTMKQLPDDLYETAMDEIDRLRTAILDTVRT